ncbi:electron transfer flavoprotein alpha subunit [Candidatus Kinetoplastibacterium blastocrithidii TCC012E]|uniref:Electron transfer flavoprotein subunit alpha n=1 Tax=Candidatus Kinetoplastidibacterium blastocrithidiae TCC012E TaxID=1208922 RepID=M1LBM7_9PROT|nr:electron transfer flavoprotein subunit alpha/FixB family protein [Candidatus Kinetoplastibacterium blastocrithidii]AFZ83725.1 electron transfer flavoprotein alpha subunit [Candidatus Kinetoplastibacterium blastocrithidii (ex Strigomonas culicis)]AGF49848.1 electron transfer flavoprotein alpha subunit [Candidatus Kinetoplastibacterium blastocrithidii TCC012E]
MILVIPDHNNESFDVSTYGLISAASKFRSSIHILIIGKDIKNLACNISKLKNVSKVFTADASHFIDFLPENHANHILSIANNYTHIIFNDSFYGRSIAPKIAAKLDVAPVSNVMKIISDNVFSAAMYAGRILANIKCIDPIKILILRGCSFTNEDINIDINNYADIENITVSNDLGLSKLLKKENRVDSSKIDLTEANVIVSGGRGLGSKENFNNLLMPLAEKLGAAIGATRVAVDEGYAPNSCQIGQTGKIVSPRLYLAIGISGSMQHLAGIKDSRTIIAINNDINAPIFNVSDYCLCGDLFEIVPKLSDCL